MLVDAAKSTPVVVEKMNTDLRNFFWRK